MNEFILLFGSASGDRIDIILKAIEIIKVETKSELIDTSSVFTELKNEGEKGVFVNAAALFKGDILPDKKFLENVEVLLGRMKKTEKEHTHTLDIDLMMWKENGFIFLGKEKYFKGGYPFFALNQIKKDNSFKEKINWLINEKKVELDFLNTKFYSLLSKEKFNELIKE